MRSKNRIGILGGTFNPIHNGHIALGKAACEQYALDHVLVMVSKTPPHKAGQQIPDAAVRSDMVRLAVADCDFLEYSDFELRREGYIYTADTLRLLTEQNPDNEYYFIMGGDSLSCLDRWYRPDIIVKYAVILASGRSGLKNQMLDQEIERLQKLFADADIRRVILPDIPWSSTEIRRLTAEGEDIAPMVGGPVADYIKNHGLYCRKGHSVNTKAAGKTT